LIRLKEKEEAHLKENIEKETKTKNESEENLSHINNGKDKFNFNVFSNNIIENKNILAKISVKNNEYEAEKVLLDEKKMLIQNVFSKINENLIRIINAKLMLTHELGKQQTISEYLGKESMIGLYRTSYSIRSSSLIPEKDFQQYLAYNYMKIKTKID